MNYVVSILVENDNTERLRAFASEVQARRFVEKLARRLVRLNDAGKTRLYVALAEVYAVKPSGVLRVVAHFDGHEGRGDGVWNGWDDDWKDEE
jgi:hypothetical protein